jgi:NADPH-dependent 2,4-dienoyl-CoA reductase/sulfur reductase-like enzyme
MNEERYNVIVVGSGFAGIVAANHLADQGLSILLVDENIHVGGQLLRKIPEQLGQRSKYRQESLKKIGFALIDNIKNKKIRIMNQTRVVGVYSGQNILLEVEEKRIVSLEYDALLLATGARERFLPFKGWTLPGVYSTGMVQVLLKSHGVLCAERLLVGGSGLFLMAVAYEFLKSGGRVISICEQSTFFDKAKFLSLILSQYPKYLEGAKFASRIIFSGVPLKYRTRIVEARGNGSLESVVVARVDGSGHIIQGTEKVHETPALAVGYGFVPNIEVAQLADCSLFYSESKGGWVVEVKENLETSIENIFAAGEITGIGGAYKSIHEGEMAANSILLRFEKISEREFTKKQNRMNRKRKQDLKFGALFNLLYRIPPGSLMDIPDDTTICRCEDVTMGEVRKAVSMDFKVPGSLKISVRTGMGNCQGRTCGPIIYDILTALTGQMPAQLGPFSVRPPIKPVSIGSFLDHQNQL